MRLGVLPGRRWVSPGPNKSISLRSPKTNIWFLSSNWGRVRQIHIASTLYWTSHIAVNNIARTICRNSLVVVRLVVSWILFEVPLYSQELVRLLFADTAYVVCCLPVSPLSSSAWGGPRLTFMAAHLYWSQSRFTEIFRCPFLHFQSWAEFLFIRDDDLHVINEEELRDLVVDWFAQSVAISRSQRPSQRI